MGALGTNFGLENDMEGAFVVAFFFRFQADGQDTARYEGANRNGASLGQTDFQSLYIDNSANDFDVVVRYGSLPLEMRIMKGNCAFLPIFNSQNALDISLRLIGGPRDAAIRAALISKVVGPSVWRANSAIAN